MSRAAVLLDFLLGERRRELLALGGMGPGNPDFTTEEALSRVLARASTDYTVRRALDDLSRLEREAQEPENIAPARLVELEAEAAQRMESVP